MYRERQKSKPLKKKNYISGIVAVIFTKFARLTYEDSFHIFCRFYYIRKESRDRPLLGRF